MAKEEADKTTKDRAAEMEKLKEEHSSSISQLKEGHATELLKLKEDHAAEILRLKENNELALVDEQNASYNEAMSEAVDDIKVVQNQVYKSEYEFGLESAGLLRVHELFGRVVLCPPGSFVIPLSVDSEEETDEEGEEERNFNSSGAKVAKGQT